MRNQIYFLFIILFNFNLIINCAKEKSYFNDDSLGYKEQIDSWSVEFPKDKNKNGYNYVNKPNNKNDYGYNYLSNKPSSLNYGGKIINSDDYDDEDSYEEENKYNDDIFNKKPYQDDYDNVKSNYDTNLKKPHYNNDDYLDSNKKPSNYDNKYNNKPSNYENKYDNHHENKYDRPSNYNNNYESRPTNYNDKPSNYDDKHENKYNNRPLNFENNKYDNQYDEHINSKPHSNDYTTYKPSYANEYLNKPSSNDHEIPHDKPTYDKPNHHENKPNYPSKNEQHSTYKLTCYDKEETCTPQNKCPIHRFDDYDTIQKCSLSNGKTGICCPPPEESTSRGQPSNLLPISKKATKTIYPKIKYYPNANRNQYRSLNEDYDTRIKFVKQIERKLVDHRLIPSKNSPEMAHINFFGNHKEARKMGSIGERSIVQALELAKKFFEDRTDASSLEELMSSSSSVQINANLNSTECPRDPICKITKYRTPDGTCNNKYYPQWGKSFIAYNRILSANYGDGLNSPALSKSKQELPNARMLSVELTRHKYPPTSRLSLIAMQFGQFIDHDIASAAPTRTEQGLPISCCNPAVQRDPENLKHPSCYEIPISENDPFYSKFNITCMNFVRSIATQRQDCKLAPREQMNQPTSFIDGSQIYGSNLETQLSLRTFNGGQLLSTLVNHFQFLPRQTNGTCNVPNNEVQKCFKAGDPRSNENIDLTVLQTVFLREHNRVAKELEELNPQWSDEELYQEAKAIVTAELQHITYNEFLPSLLNRQTMKQFDLYPTEQGFNYKYNPKINPTLFNSFATAGYRLHSTIQGILQLRNNKDELIGEIPLSATFNNPSLLSKPGVYDGLIRGMTSQPMQELDQYFTSEVTNRLFKPHNASFGLDIFSLNLQRGRDHGLRGYTRYQKQCGLQPIKSFNDLDTRMPKKLVNFFKRHYESVHDIDLYAAGIVENHLPNSEVGPTFSCLIGEQFRRLKYGDSFFYENAGFMHSFTAEQLAEIKKVTLARLLCDNGDFVEYMQPNAFILPKYWFNKKVSCNSSELIEKMCLLPWSKSSTYKKK